MADATLGFEALGHEQAVSASHADVLRTRSEEARIRAMMANHFDSVWRALKHIGVDDADDAAQQVFLIAVRRLTSIGEGQERAFLLATAARVAWRARRTVARRREVLEASLPTQTDPTPGPEQLIERERARAAVDQILSMMDMPLRAVFVLFEIEELTTAQIAEALGLPQGTVASRLRRAREEFKAHVRRLEARTKVARGPR
jgi:RNA polymerase sigma-70 factor (ECF subfamily)